VTKSAVSRQYVDVKEPDRLAGSELEAFDAIYEREFDYVWRSLGRLGVPHADLGDATHDVFVVLYRRWNVVDRERALRPWLFGVARRVAAGMRAKRRELPVDVDVRAPDGADVAKRDLVWRALDQLDEDRRTVVILHDLEGHTGARIAEMLGISVNTVHSRLRLARAELVEIVRKLGGPR
jgi:RNA polymerase sigma-70 factor (ECF subfamily)